MSPSSSEQIFRLSAAYTLDQLAGPRVLFDILDTLIGVAVGQANVAPVTADRELQMRHATYEQPPPDDLRRAVSINALAQSLRLPFETVRRRIVKLSILGACRITPSGVVVPTKALFSPLHRGWMQRNYDLTRDFWREIRPLLPASPPTPAAPTWQTAPPLRLVARHAYDYVLRFSDLLIGFVDDDPTGAAVWAAALDCGESNVQEIRDRAGVSRETARRRVHALADRGLLEMTRGRVAAPAAILASDAAQRMLARNHADTVRLFTALDGFGVLGAWGRGPAERAA